ncbi:MAG TPA: hypothetical protein DDW20_02215 [Firmicutes bacterium]|nr:hypothetical protein [Bacillota bacterium]
MRKNIIGLVTLLAISLSFVKQPPVKNVISDENIVNAVTTEITMKQIADFLITKKEHYPLSDEFIERYQQSSGGYLDYAKQVGHVVDKSIHEPNQKWHFFDSWYYRTIEEEAAEGNDFETASAKSRVYSMLLCPELLLWIYEACDVSPSKVKKAKDVAEQGKSSKTSTTTIASNMRKVVAWEDLEVNILEYLNQ